LPNTIYLTDSEWYSRPAFMGSRVAKSPHIWGKASTFVHVVIDSHTQKQTVAQQLQAVLTH